MKTTPFYGRTKSETQKKESKTSDLYPCNATDDPSPVLPEAEVQASGQDPDGLSKLKRLHGTLFTRTFCRTLKKGRCSVAVARELGKRSNSVKAQSIPRVPIHPRVFVIYHFCFFGKAAKTHGGAKKKCANAPPWDNNKIAFSSK